MNVPRKKTMRRKMQNAVLVEVLTRLYVSFARRRPNAQFIFVDTQALSYTLHSKAESGSGQSRRNSGQNSVRARALSGTPHPYWHCAYSANPGCA